jgi:hypothetical protein
VRRNALGILIVFVLLATLPHPARCAELSPPLSPDAALDLAVLRAAYPGVVQGLERNPAGHLELVLTSGQRLMYDDGRTDAGRQDAGLPAAVSAEAKKTDGIKQDLATPDLRTMLAQVYPLGPVDEASANPKPGFDPGRSRVQALFLALYGHSEAEVRAHCAKVRFDRRTLPFNTRFGAAPALERVWKRIEAQLPQHPEFLPVLRPLGETLVWRVIAGTKRLSMHSFGIALDVNPDLPYWRWEKHPETMPAQCKAFPPEILAAFEAEGFIWGGKWASFDLMHFEYRPEIILKACVLAGQVKLP